MDGVTIHLVALPTDPEQAPDPSELPPLAGGRTVATVNPLCYEYHRRMRNAGLVHACVVTRESLGLYQPDWVPIMGELLVHLRPQWWILGNEMDAGYLGADSPASDAMTPDEYAQFVGALLPLIRSMQPQAKVASAGLVSGQPKVALEYRHSLDQLDALNIHPWGKAAWEAADLFALYRAAFPDMPLVVGEWNREADEIPEYVDMLESEGVEWASFFSYHTFDVPGLVDKLNRRTARYYALSGALSAIEEPTMATWVPGHDFERFAAEHPEVGEPLTDEVTIGTAQLATGGLLVYLNAPASKTVLLPWAVIDNPPATEPPVVYTPTIEQVRGNASGTFQVQPQGVILHGTRSGQNYTTRQEYDATVNYVKNGAGGLGWSATIGDDVIALHLLAGEWGWNSRAASSKYLAVEFAQATVDREISPAQVKVFAWWFLNRARVAWPNLPLTFPTHAELPEGQADGKTDPMPRGDPRADQLRARILAEIKRQGG